MEQPAHAHRPVLPSTRAVAGVLVVLLALAVGGLYGWPGATDRHFAWTIVPELTPLVMGAGYASGVVFFAFVATGRRWLEVSFGFVGITVFATLMGIATLIHWDRFDHDHPTFWAWVAIYAVAPVLVPALWLSNGGWRPGAVEPGEREMPGWARLVVAVTGFALFAVGLAVFVRPQLAVDHWPWDVSPLTARVLGSFTALNVGWAAAALDRRWSAYRIPALSSLTGTVLVLLALVRGRDDLRGGVAVSIYVAVAATLALVLAAVLVATSRTGRAVR